MAPSRKAMMACVDDTTCLDGLIWSYSSLREDPCAAWAYVQQICREDGGTQNIIESALAVQPSSQHDDNVGSDIDILCEYSTMAYTLFRACESRHKRVPLPWHEWKQGSTSKSLDVQKIEEPGWSILKRSDIIVPRDVAASNTTASSSSDSDSAASTTTTQPFRMNPAISGVIGALCALVVGLVVVSGVVLIVRQRRRRHLGQTKDANRTSIFSFMFGNRPYKKRRPRTATSSYVGLRMEEGHGSEEQPVLLITREAADFRRFPRQSEDSLYLPDYLYIPSAVEISPANQSSRMSATPMTAESGVLGLASRLEDEDARIPRHIKTRSQTM